MMEEKVYMGIDPGNKGFITIQEKGDFTHVSIEDNDLYQLSDKMREIRLKHTNLTCVIESVHAVFGSSAKATFAFGFNNGYLIGLLCANKIPYVLVPPQKWQKEMWEHSDMVVTYKQTTIKGKQIMKKDVNTKQTSINCCKRLFPMLDLRKSERAKKIDDNKVDSILLCEYGRRKNL